MPTNYPTLDYGGPQWLRFYATEPEYAVVQGPLYADKGQDTFLSFTNPVRRWVFDYEGLTEVEAQILDDHFASAYGTHLGFAFTDPRTGTAYTGVKYERYERPAHEKVWLQSRRVQLIKRP